MVSRVVGGGCAAAGPSMARAPHSWRRPSQPHPCHGPQALPAAVSHSQAAMEASQVAAGRVWRGASGADTPGGLGHGDGWQWLGLRATRRLLPKSSQPMARPGGSGARTRVQRGEQARRLLHRRVAGQQHLGDFVKVAGYSRGGCRVGEPGGERQALIGCRARRGRAPAEERCSSARPRGRPHFQGAHRCHRPRSAAGQQVGGRRAGEPASAQGPAAAGCQRCMCSSRLEGGPPTPLRRAPQRQSGRRCGWWSRCAQSQTPPSAQQHTRGCPGPGPARA